MDRLPLLADAAHWSHAEDAQQFVSARQPSTADLLLVGVMHGEDQRVFLPGFLCVAAGWDFVFVHPVLALGP